MARDDRDAFGRDLEAALQARESVGSEYDDAFVDAIVERIDTEVARRVDAEVRRRHWTRRPPRGYPVSLAYVSIALGIPITGIAGATGDVEGIIAAWGGIAALNLLAATRGLGHDRDRDRRAR
ncbi:hypothetical protein [Solicola gregarius]|uniref:Integral membrane protein n=1 Tax=Solicola gregarius TaxID=2908642 RepID=A0AA46YKW8_9ACTN|nr:hypothetical protein [Solicola gregarius]UYM05039.1 hypothetical protein L0C25_21365 [Solicola gregarius]